MTAPMPLRTRVHAIVGEKVRRENVLGFQRVQLPTPGKLVRPAAALTALSEQREDADHAVASAASAASCKSLLLSRPGHD
jgi:hypothetical protein